MSVANLGVLRKSWEEGHKVLSEIKTSSGLCVVLQIDQKYTLNRYFELGGYGTVPKEWEVSVDVSNGTLNDVWKNLTRVS